MITINLLPISAFRQRRKGQVFLAALGLFLLVMIAGLFSFKSNIMDLNLENLESELSQQQSRLTAVRKQVNDAGRITASTVKKWQQLEAIIQLEERRRDLTRLLVELDDLLPQGSAWLLNLTHNKGLLTIEGISKDKEVISQFLSKLEGATYIDRNSVNLMEIAQNMVINQVSLTRFKITAQTVFPEPVVLDEGMPELGLPSREEMIKVVEAAAPNLVANIKSNATKSGKAL
ncbi:hypothetical protein C4J81_08245 [Deltaproteobacteria bacterium Smac51]|nr:hypothetical protein C4J81_08245 [Deltaproteobacteria bacterium Smac51]